ncbi:MAG: hypothetical protein ACP5OA_05550 [Candidatus Woesearchaeota archaeon]
MVKESKKVDKNKESYDVSDVIVIDDKRKGDDFELGRDDLDVTADDDDELDFDADFEFDDGGD